MLKRHNAVRNHRISLSHELWDIEYLARPELKSMKVQDPEFEMVDFEDVFKL